ncbi:hypothetical protein B0H19DRAFT_1079592 [Mycena capillaripes]|nr:hypothetical protein B0H19DRAFT_1079592 [Mycena capillaripes]
MNTNWLPRQLCFVLARTDAAVAVFCRGSAAPSIFCSTHLLTMVFEPNIRNGLSDFLLTDRGHQLPWSPCISDLIGTTRSTDEWEVVSIYRLDINHGINGFQMLFELYNEATRPWGLGPTIVL